jgi:hypothetical protein
MRNRPDKRYFSRLKTNSFYIEYKIADSDVVYKAEVINISAGGICFLRTSILEKGDIIQLKFLFSAKKIVLTGEVIRIEGREAAIKFIDEDQKIDRFVEYFNAEFGKTRIKSEQEILKDFMGNEQKKMNDFIDSEDD